MKIGIDTFGCNHAQSGNGSYLLNIISNLPSSKDIDIELFGYEVDRYTYEKNGLTTFVSVDINENVKSEQKWHKQGLKKFIKKNKYDVVLFPAFEKVLPVCSKIKTVAVINSIPSSVIKQNKKSYKSRLIKSLKETTKIIAGTNFVKNDLISLGINPEKIEVIQNGIDHKLFFPFVNSDSEYININPFAIKKPYFVYGSSISSEGKKHKQLIKAFEIFKKNTGLPHRLVIAGSDGDFASEVHKAILSSPYASDIFLTGYFPHDSFATLYAGSAASVFPSIDEGVGLPIIEAMACGIPVICSDKGALKEVGGEIPLYFDSDNEDKIAELMQVVIENSELRSKMIESGLKEAAFYNWDLTISKTLDLIQKL